MSRCAWLLIRESETHFYLVNIKLKEMIKGVSQLSSKLLLGLIYVQPDFLVKLKACGLDS